jgi:ribonuclease HI
MWKLELRWVPGHNGVEGNELADTLAREGFSTTPIGPITHILRRQTANTAQENQKLLKISSVSAWVT